MSYQGQKKQAWGPAFSICLATENSYVTWTSQSLSLDSFPMTGLGGEIPKVPSEMLCQLASSTRQVGKQRPGEWSHPPRLTQTLPRDKVRAILSS